MSMSKRLVALVLATAGFLQPVVAITPAENRYARYALFPLPSCGSQEVLGFVTSHFSSREYTYWNSALQIDRFDRVHEQGVRPWGPNFVPRRFCTARAFLSDGHSRHVNYFVRESIGIFGNTWDVTWCVIGLDRHRTYAPNCEQATAW